MGLRSLLWLALGLSGHAWALTWEQPYFPPEAEESSPTITIPHCVNINKDGFNFLMTLSGMTEDVALKIIRLRERRPIKKASDLYQLPISRVEVSVLLERTSDSICY